MWPQPSGLGLLSGSPCSGLCDIEPQAAIDSSTGTQRHPATTPGKLGSGVLLLPLCSTNWSAATAVEIVVCEWQVAEQEGIAVCFYLQPPSPPIQPLHVPVPLLSPSGACGAAAQLGAQLGCSSASFVSAQLSRKQPGSGRVTPGHWGAQETSSFHALCGHGVRSRCVPGCVCDGVVSHEEPQSRLGGPALCPPLG